jgi:hypothetical protein
MPSPARSAHRRAAAGRLPIDCNHDIAFDDDDRSDVHESGPQSHLIALELESESGGGVESAAPFV